MATPPKKPGLIPPFDFNIMFHFSERSLELCFSTEDEMAANDYLWGFTDTSAGLAETIYLEKIGEHAVRKCRRALVRVLRSEQPLNKVLRNHLAELFDDASKATHRILEIGNRKKGGKPNRSAERQVGKYIESRRRVGIKQEAAIEEAMKRFHVARSTVLKHLGNYRKSRSPR
jgi:hypothetical protein